MWHIRKNCSLFITSGTLSQLTESHPFVTPQKIDFRRLESSILRCMAVSRFFSPIFRISLKIGKNADLNPLSKSLSRKAFRAKKPDFKAAFGGAGLTETTPKNGHPRLVA